MQYVYFLLHTVATIFAWQLKLPRTLIGADHDGPYSSLMVPSSSIGWEVLIVRL